MLVTYPILMASRSTSTNLSAEGWSVPDPMEDSKGPKNDKTFAK